MLGLALWLARLPSPAQTAEPWESLTKHKEAIRAHSIEYVPYVRPFEVNGTFTSRKPETMPAGAGYIPTPNELLSAGTEVETDATGAMSLLLGETGEAGFARLGPNTLVKLPPPPNATGPTKEGTSPGISAASRDIDTHPHSLEFQKGSLFLNVKAGQMVHIPAIRRKEFQFRLDTDFVLVTPLATITTKERHSTGNGPRARSPENSARGARTTRRAR